MLSEKAKGRMLECLLSSIDSAEMLIDGETVEAPIIRAERQKDILKVFLNITQGQGQVSDIYILDADGEVVIHRPQMILKKSAYGLMSAFYIKLVEEEVEDPIKTFNLGGDS